MINSTSDEPYVGIVIDAYINETREIGSVSHKIGTGVSDAEGFVEIICNGTSLASIIRAGDWVIQLHRPLQFVTHANESKRIIQSWSPTLDLKIKGNSTIQLNIPDDFTGASGDTAIAGLMVRITFKKVMIRLRWLAQGSS